MPLVDVAGEGAGDGDGDGEGAGDGVGEGCVGPGRAGCGDAAGAAPDGVPAEPHPTNVAAQSVTSATTAMRAQRCMLPKTHIPLLLLCSAAKKKRTSNMRPLLLGTEVLLLLAQLLQCGARALVIPG